MTLKKLIEAYIIIAELNENYRDDFYIKDPKSTTHYNLLYNVKEKLHEKIVAIYPEFLNEPFIINEYIIVWDRPSCALKFYPKKEIL